jgi:formylglycine-generating enzyme required for sulfatase activity
VTLAPPGITLVVLPAGTFYMGTRKGEDLANPKAEDWVERRIRAPFAISQYEITVAQYWSIVDPGHQPKPGEGNKPIANITWDEANGFCQRLTLMNLRTRRRFRLPTEVQWEYACRAGTDAPFALWRGDTGETGASRAHLEQAMALFRNGDGATLDRRAQTCFVFKTSGARDAAEGWPNAWGLCNVHGNVAEWCDFDPDLPPPARTDADARPIRGGAYNSDTAIMCRAGRRAFQLRSRKTPAIGFRLVQEMP